MTAHNVPPFRAAPSAAPVPPAAPVVAAPQAILGLEAQVKAAIAEQTAAMQAQLSSLMQEAGKVSALPFRAGG